MGTDRTRRRYKHGMIHEYIHFLFFIRFKLHQRKFFQASLAFREIAFA